MKKIISYFKDYLKTTFHAGYYLTIAIFLVIFLSLNYHFQFERTILRPYFGQEIRFLHFFLFYSIPYYFSVLAMAYFKNKWEVFKSRKFWFRSLFFIAIASFDREFYYYQYLTEFIHPYAQGFASRCFYNLGGIVTILLPLLIYYLIKDKRNSESFYGLRIKGFDWKPYAIMLLMMVPIIGIAATGDGFMNYYPRYKSFPLLNYFHIKEVYFILIYEACYAFDFISIELLFRGFLILGMVKILGKEVVIPMAVTYCFLHFGKPIGEAVSSIIGGYILGVIALYSRNILGGVFIHVGIALLMELAAFTLKHFL